MVSSDEVMKQEVQLDLVSWPSLFSCAREPTKVSDAHEHFFLPMLNRRGFGGFGI